MPSRIGVTRSRARCLVSSTATYTRLPIGNRRARAPPPATRPRGCAPGRGMPPTPRSPRTSSRRPSGPPGAAPVGARPEPHGRPRTLTGLASSVRPAKRETRRHTPPRRPPTHAEHLDASRRRRARYPPVVPAPPPWAHSVRLRHPRSAGRRSTGRSSLAPSQAARRVAGGQDDDGDAEAILLVTAAAVVRTPSPSSRDNLARLRSRARCRPSTAAQSRAPPHGRRMPHHISRRVRQELRQADRDPPLVRLRASQSSMASRARHTQSCQKRATAHSRPRGSMCSACAMRQGSHRRVVSCSQALGNGEAIHPAPPRAPTRRPRASPTTSKPSASSSARALARNSALSSTISKPQALARPSSHHPRSPGSGLSLCG